MVTVNPIPSYVEDGAVLTYRHLEGEVVVLGLTEKETLTLIAFLTGNSTTEYATIATSIAHAIVSTMSRTLSADS